MKKKIKIIKMKKGRMEKRARMDVFKGILPLLYLLFALAASGQVGIQTDTPDASAALEISSGDKGLLIPRVSLSSSLTNPAPVSSPANGLLVYNSGANQAEGFYFWTGSAWQMLKPSESNDVQGPASSTDNAVARFDGTSGNVIQNSVVILDDAGNISGVNNITVNSFTMPTNAGADKVMVSDASGNGSWDEALPLDVEENNVVVAAGVNTINFQGAVDVIDNGNHKATVSVSQTLSEEEVIQLGSTDNLDLNNLTTPVAIPWDVEIFKDVSAFVHSNTSNPTRISVNYQGVYEINYMFSIENVDNQRKTLRSRLRKNGSSYIEGSASYSFTYSKFDDKSTHVSSSFLVELQPGDYLEIMVNGQTNSGAVNLIPNENLLFMRIMRTW
ncbi:MAG: hypothetical protein U5Q03_19005 [Bacteroidota bacterium]|nr:hypothetical protein [Bacteroidota bacterium]